MDVVIQTYPKQDGLKRKARMQTTTSVYDLPIHKLCLDRNQTGTKCSIKIEIYLVAQSIHKYK